MFISFATIFFTFSAPYKIIRESTFLTMSHPRYFKLFTSITGWGNLGIDSSRITYLNKTFSTMEDTYNKTNIEIMKFLLTKTIFEYLFSDKISPITCNYVKASIHKWRLKILQYTKCWNQKKN